MENPFSRIVLIFSKVFYYPGITAGETDDPYSPAAGKQLDVTKEQLDAIQAEITSLRAEANKLAAEENSITSQLAQFDLEYQAETHEIELLALKQQQTEADIQQLQSQFQVLDSRMSQQKKYLATRLVEVYKLGKLNYLKLMLQANSAGDMLRGYRYITFLAKDDNRRVQTYRDSINEMTNTQVSLRAQSQDLAQLRQESEEAHQALEQTRKEKLKLLASIQDRKDVHTNAMTELKIAAMQLQRFFSKIEPVEEPVLVPSQGSIIQYKGALSWPVRGKVVRGFGNEVHPVFGTKTVSNGIEIAASEGTDVRAVFGGKVVFSEWFKGYGQAIIVSHPDGYYTMYAHNSELLAHRGDSIERGQIIARVGFTGASTEPSLYFEIREKEKPVNPLLWLRK
jgi:septal ring factor EnvC (AmiA/AmiB activator)